MIKFKFVSTGFIFAKERRDWLSPKTKSLPNPFKFEDIKPNTFSKSVMKRLKSAKTDGVQITLRKGIGYSISIEVINKEDRTAAKKQATKDKRFYRKKLRQLKDDPEVKTVLGGIAYLGGQLDSWHHEARTVLGNIDYWIEKLLE